MYVDQRQKLTHYPWESFLVLGSVIVRNMGYRVR